MLEVPPAYSDCPHRPSMAEQQRAIYIRGREEVGDVWLINQGGPL